MKKVILKVENLNKIYLNKKILDDLNFEIYEKEILGLIGVSGCGKTTLLNIISGFIKPTSGQILYNNSFFTTNSTFVSLFSDYNKIKSLIGFSAQDPSLYKELTILDNLKLFGILQNLNPDLIVSRAFEILKIFDLYEQKDLLVSSISEGMKKRLDLACSIIHKPKILILDEPTSNLDILIRKEILKYIKKINKEGITIIFVSHYLEEIQDLCKRVLIINKSKIIKDKVTKNLENNFIKILKTNGKN